MKIALALSLNFLLTGVCYATPSIRDAYEGGVSIEFVIGLLIALWILGKFTDKPGELLAFIAVMVLAAVIVFGFGSAVISLIFKKPITAIVLAYVCFYAYYFIFRKKK